MMSQRLVILCTIILLFSPLCEAYFKIPHRLSVARSDLAATSVGDLVLYGGGRESAKNIPSNVVDIYNSSSGIWTNTSLSIPRYNLAATSVGNLAFFGGGVTVNGTQYLDLNVVDIYNSTSGTWYTAGISVARNTLVAASVGDLVIFAGGYGTPQQSIVDIYNCTSGVWSNTSFSVSSYKIYVTATSIRNLAFFGVDSNPILDVYDVTNNMWTSFNASIRVTTFVAMPISNLIVFNGEEFGKRVLNIYNFTSDLSTRSSLSSVRYGVTGTSGGNLAIFGGYSSNATGVVECYNPATEARLSAATLQIPRLMISVGNLALFSSSDDQIGEIKFCNSSDECIDDLFCTDDNCIDGVCQYSDHCQGSVCTSNCSESLRSCYAEASILCEDDGLHCNGKEICDGRGNCVHSGSPCPTARCFTCDESINGCRPSPPFSQCNDDNICNGDDFCDASGQCLSNGTFASPGTVCLEDAICDGEGRCVSNSQKQEKDSTDKVLIGVLVPLFVIIIVASIVIFLLWRRKRNSHSLGTLIEMGTHNSLTDVQVEYRIGGGNFGDVYKGTWNGTTPVALKMLKDASQMADFSKETELLRSLKHPNIVQYLGVYKSPAGEEYIVTEYLSEGSLQSTVISERTNLTPLDLLSMAKQAAAGMAFLEQQKIVHRDLALRNLLASKSGGQEKYLVKVSDFGLSRMAERGYYKANERTIPIKWTPPEAIEFNSFTSKSDVWSFGVLLWELFSYGRVPYPSLNNKETLEEVKKGYRMPAPENCPHRVYELMQDCWKALPEDRPTFKHLFAKMEQIWRELLSTKEAIPNSTQPNMNNSEILQSFPQLPR